VPAPRPTTTVVSVMPAVACTSTQEMSRQVATSVSTHRTRANQPPPGKARYGRTTGVLRMRPAMTRCALAHQRSAVVDARRIGRPIQKMTSPSPATEPTKNRTPISATTVRHSAAIVSMNRFTQAIIPAGT